MREPGLEPGFRRWQRPVITTTLLSLVFRPLSRSLNDCRPRHLKAHTSEPLNIPHVHIYCETRTENSLQGAFALRWLLVRILLALLISFNRSPSNSKRVVDDLVVK